LRTVSLSFTPGEEPATSTFGGWFLGSFITKGVGQREEV